MPMIRYAIGDSGRLQDGDCPCGSPFPLMEMGMCRQNDLILAPDGRRIHPSYFNGLLYGLTQIAEYQFVQDATGKIALRMVAAPLDQRTVGALRDRLRRDAGLELDLTYVDAIERSVSGKHRFVISRI
jgi:phenylacetate-CoA ligase